MPSSGIKREEPIVQLEAHAVLSECRCHELLHTRSKVSGLATSHCNLHVISIL